MKSARESHRMANWSMGKTLWTALAMSAFVLVATVARATTWDEPWHEAVVKAADCFVLVEVLTNDGGQRISAKVLKHLAGQALSGVIAVEGFYLLTVTSTTEGFGPEIRLPKGFVGYLFLKKSKDSYQLATPTAGYAAVKDGKVNATYRHSYHQALVDQDLYEQSSIAIFNFLHNQPYDRQFVQGLFKKYLTMPPAPPPSETAFLFFHQHVALESFCYFGEEKESGLLEPFLKDKVEHAQISAVRALGRIDSKAARQRLIAFITEADRSPFAKVMAVWSLRRLNARELAPQLKAYAAEAKDEPCGFGGNIMDPRIGTSFPESVKAAIQALLKDWESKAEARPSRWASPSLPPRAPRILF